MTGPGMAAEAKAWAEAWRYRARHRRNRWRELNREVLVLAAKVDALSAALADGSGTPQWEETAAYGDPASLRVQARRRRLEASGLRVVKGGGL